MSQKSLRGKDTMDETVAFLQKRDGIDKVLKIARYATKLALATTLVDPAHADLRVRLENLESSLGTSRKAYRTGKFLQNLNAIRKVPLRTPYAALDLVAQAGECLYYFFDQFQWLVRSGVLPPRVGPRLTKLSASGELLGYVANVTLTVLRLHNILEREVALIAELNRRRAQRAQAGGAPSDDEKDQALVAEIRQLRARRALRTLGLAQDIADALLALSDLRDSRDGVLGNRALLAAAGLLSGCISAYKNWPGVSQ